MPTTVRNIQRDTALIQEIQDHPCVWKVNHVDRNNTMILREAWDEICKKVGMKKKTAQGRWQQLQQMYKDEKNLIPKMRSGTGGNRYKSRWPLFQHMSFIDDDVEPFESSGNLNDLNREDQDSDSNSNSSDERYPVENDSNGGGIDCEDEDDLNCEEDIDSVTERNAIKKPLRRPKTTEHSTKSLTINKKNRESTLQNFEKPKRVTAAKHFQNDVLNLEKEKLQLFKSLQNKKSTTPESEDWLFLKTLLPHLSLVKKEEKLLCYRKLTEIVHDFAYSFSTWSKKTDPTAKCTFENNASKKDKTSIKQLDPIDYNKEIPVDEPDPLFEHYPDSKNATVKDYTEPAKGSGKKSTESGVKIKSIQILDKPMQIKSKSPKHSPVSKLKHLGKENRLAFTSGTLNEHVSLTSPKKTSKNYDSREFLQSPPKKIHRIDNSASPSFPVSPTSRHNTLQQFAIDRKHKCAIDSENSVNYLPNNKYYSQFETESYRQPFISVPPKSYFESKQQLMTPPASMATANPNLTINFETSREPYSENTMNVCTSHYMPLNMNANYQRTQSVLNNLTENNNFLTEYNNQLYDKNPVDLSMPSSGNDRGMFSIQTSTPNATSVPNNKWYDNNIEDSVLEETAYFNTDEYSNYIDRSVAYDRSQYLDSGYQNSLSQSQQQKEFASNRFNISSILDEHQSLVGQSYAQTVQESDRYLPSQNTASPNPILNNAQHTPEQVAATQISQIPHSNNMRALPDEAKWGFESVEQCRSPLKSLEDNRNVCRQLF